jgi:hypothetical protein
MVMKLRPSPRDEAELCSFLSYVAELKRVYNKLRNNSSINANLSHLLTFLRVRSGQWTRAEELSYNRLQSEISRVIWSHKNAEICYISSSSFLSVQGCTSLKWIRRVNYW